MTDPIHDLLETHDLTDEQREMVASVRRWVAVGTEFRDAPSVSVVGAWQSRVLLTWRKSTGGLSAVVDHDGTVTLKRLR